MKYGNLVKRSLIMVLGLFLGAFGFSFCLKADFGLSAMGCCPAVFCIPLKVSVGTAMWIYCALFIIAQIIILRRDFPPVQLFQIVVAYLFGYFSDFSSMLIQSMPADTLLLRIIFLIIGIGLNSICVFLLLKADLFMMSPEAMLHAISKKYKFDFSKMKVIMDCSMVAVAVIGSLIMFRRVIYIGIGTLLAALFVGRIVGLLKKIKSLNNALDKLASHQPA